MFNKEICCYINNGIVLFKNQDKGSKKMRQPNEEIMNYQL
jgi:hypothetical protein